MFDRSSLTLAGVVAVLGFLLVTSVSTTAEQRRSSAPRRAELASLIDERRKLVQQLDESVVSLRAQVARAQRLASRADAAALAEAQHQAQLALEAGTVAVAGAALEVRMSDSSRKPASPEEAGAYRIHDNDLQLMINALFAAGAEAVAVNGSRVVATTAIRAAGDTVVVNFRPMSSPYRIVAIGASEDALSDSGIARRFRRWEKLFGLGFSVRRVDRAVVPAFTGRSTIDDARPAGGDEQEG